MDSRALKLALAAALAGIAVAAAAQPPGPPPPDAAPRGPVFISPMGEPFRGVVDGVPPEARWLRGADRDHDGKLTLTEMRLDALRFFKTLDTNHDGEIDPDELAHYEQDVAPEVAATLAASGHRELSTEVVGGEASPMADDAFSDIPLPRYAKRGRLQSGRREGVPTSYLPIAEPVASCDRDLNRGVSLREFDAAAQQRFHLLDKSNLGYLTTEGLKTLLR